MPIYELAVSAGHTLVVPRRHVEGLFELSDLRSRPRHPRFRGDVPDPRGGVRWIIPAKDDWPKGWRLAAG